MQAGPPQIAGCKVAQVGCVDGGRSICRVLQSRKLQAGKHRRRWRRSRSHGPRSQRPLREQGEVGGLDPEMAERFASAGQRHSPDPRGLARIVKKYVLEGRVAKEHWITRTVVYPPPPVIALSYGVGLRSRRSVGQPIVVFGVASSLHDSGVCALLASCCTRDCFLRRANGRYRVPLWFGQVSVKLSSWPMMFYISGRFCGRFQTAREADKQALGRATPPEVSFQGTGCDSKSNRQIRDLGCVGAEEVAERQVMST